ncbi:MAG: RNA polymerase sigma factor [Anaerolineae bacterium]|nr:RNA polymerase sigma factor [Anaerolineae bacterium]
MSSDYRDSIEQHTQARGQELLRRIARRDRDAMTEFFLTYEISVCRYVRHVLSGIGEEDLREIVQETFLAVLRSAAAYRAEASVATWLLQIARHKAMDWLRREYRVRKHEVALDDPAQAGDRSALTEVTDLDDDTLQVRRALALLPPDQREVLTLRYVLGMSVDEVAQVMRYSRRKVELLITQGRSALRTLLSQQGSR